MYIHVSLNWGLGRKCLCNDSSCESSSGHQCCVGQHITSHVLYMDHIPSHVEVMSSQHNTVVSSQHNTVMSVNMYWDTIHVC